MVSCTDNEKEGDTRFSRSRAQARSVCSAAIIQAVTRCCSTAYGVVWYATHSARSSMYSRRRNFVLTVAMFSPSHFACRSLSTHSPPQMYCWPCHFNKNLVIEQVFYQVSCDLLTVFHELFHGCDQFPQLCADAHPVFSTPPGFLS